MKISDTAIVEDCNIGSGTTIWHFANLYGCEIGEDCNIGSYVEVQEGVGIGDRVIVSSHTFICSRVTIQNDVFIGHGVMTINDVYPPSFRRTGEQCEWRDTLIMAGAVIGSNATIFPVVIGKNAVVGAGAVVRENVPDNTVVAGNPAKVISEEVN